MTPLLTNDELANRVCSGGVLYTITLRRFGTQKIDKEASAKARADAGITDKDSAAVYKKILNADTIKRIRKLDAYIYTIPRKYGAPWGDGTYFIPASKYIDMTREVKIELAKRDLLLKEVANEYNIARAEAQVRLGTMYNDDDLPPVDQVISKFAAEVRTAQVGTPNGNMLGVFGDIAAAVMNDVNETFNDQIASMVPYIKEVLLQPLIKMSASLQNPNTTFRDTLFTNVWEAAERAKGLNVLEDDVIDAAVTEINNHLRINPDAAREEGTPFRGIAAGDCARIIEHLGGEIPPPAPDSNRKLTASEIFAEMEAQAQNCSPEGIAMQKAAMTLLDERTITEPTDEQIDAVADAALAHISDPADREDFLIEKALAETSGEDILAKLGW